MIWTQPILLFKLQRLTLNSAKTTLTTLQTTANTEEQEYKDACALLAQREAELAAAKSALATLESEYTKALEEKTKLESEATYSKEEYDQKIAACDTAITNANSIKTQAETDRNECISELKSYGVNIDTTSTDDEIKDAVNTKTSSLNGDAKAKQQEINVLETKKSGYNSNIDLLKRMQSNWSSYSNSANKYALLTNRTYCDELGFSVSSASIVFINKSEVELLFKGGAKSYFTKAVGEETSTGKVSAVNSAYDDRINDKNAEKANITSTIDKINELYKKLCDISSKISSAEYTKSSQQALKIAYSNSYNNSSYMRDEAIAAANTNCTEIFTKKQTASESVTTAQAAVNSAKEAKGTAYSDLTTAQANITKHQYNATEDGTLASAQKAYDSAKSAYDTKKAAYASAAFDNANLKSAVVACFGYDENSADYSNMLKDMATYYNINGSENATNIKTAITNSISNRKALSTSTNGYNTLTSDNFKTGYNAWLDSLASKGDITSAECSKLKLTSKITETDGKLTFTTETLTPTEAANQKAALYSYVMSALTVNRINERKLISYKTSLTNISTDNASYEYTKASLQSILDDARVKGARYRAAYDRLSYREPVVANNNVEETLATRLKRVYMEQLNAGETIVANRVITRSIANINYTLPQYGSVTVHDNDKFNFDAIARNNKYICLQAYTFGNMSKNVVYDSDGYFYYDVDASSLPTGVKLLYLDANGKMVETTCTKLPNGKLRFRLPKNATVAFMAELESILSSSGWMKDLVVA